jgi:hypothetical protein
MDQMGLGPFFALPLLLYFSMGLLGKIFLAKGGFDKKILYLPSFLQLLLTFYKVLSITNMLKEL